MTKHEDLPYIKHIADAIMDIESFTAGLSKEKFMKDKLRQSAVVRQLEIVGEATKNVSEKTRMRYAEIEWKKIAGARDKIIHHYFGIDFGTVWDIIRKDIPDLKKKIELILSEGK